MHRYQQAAAAVLLVFAAFIVWQALRLQYYTPLGPGAGFFAVWLGALLGLLALVQLVQVTRLPRLPAADPADRVNADGEAGEDAGDEALVVGELDWLGGPATTPCWGRFTSGVTTSAPAPSTAAATTPPARARR